MFKDEFEYETTAYNAFGAEFHIICLMEAIPAHDAAKDEYQYVTKLQAATFESDEPNVMVTMSREFFISMFNEHQLNKIEEDTLEYYRTHHER